MSTVSLVIPVYNAEKYLEQCLDSVVKQTIFPEMEVIAVNDGSSDNSLNILNRYSERYPNIHVYTQENKGIALSREKILNNVWNYDYFGDARTIDTHVKKLRSKLGAKGDLIKTIWGMGYKMENE